MTKNFYKDNYNRNYSTYLFDINKNQDIVSKIQDSIVLMEL